MKLLIRIGIILSAAALVMLGTIGLVNSGYLANMVPSRGRPEGAPQFSNTQASQSSSAIPTRPAGGEDHDSGSITNVAEVLKSLAVVAVMVVVGSILSFGQQLFLKRSSKRPFATGATDL